MTTEREENLADALTRIKQWADAYPVHIFRPVSEEELARARQLLTDNGFRIDALHAEWARYLLDGVGEVTTAALEGRPER